ncbi:hypothetical protein KIPB_007241 [Kipferlia bialata]|uniref:Kelch-type beta propeller n=1 Tax=Kipferlia bialata TaxID=797122 RepID=A0A9K3D0I6_9EUKA|nr:hypothetical protein KIPB_007241 [Kipferlia bialata]|eukprot:g7241.t1
MQEHPTDLPAWLHVEASHVLEREERFERLYHVGENTVLALYSYSIETRGLTKMALLTLLPDCSLQKTTIPIPDWTSGDITKFSPIPSSWGVIYFLVTQCTICYDIYSKCETDSPNRIDIWMLHLDTLVWKMIPHSEGDIWPSPRKYCFSGCIDGNLVLAGGCQWESRTYVLGGCIDDQKYLRDTWALDTETLRWRHLPFYLAAGDSEVCQWKSVQIRDGFCYARPDWLSEDSKKSRILTLSVADGFVVSNADLPTPLLEIVGDEKCSVILLFQQHDDLLYIFDPVSRRCSSGILVEFPAIGKRGYGTVELVCMINPTTLLVRHRDVVSVVYVEWESVVELAART